MRSRIGFVAATALLAGFKIVQTSTSGGSIVSASGEHDCAEDRVCEIDIPNGDPFSESFTTVARYGYAFPGWPNQLLLATETGYDDVSDRLPDDTAGFTHNASVGDVDGDGDIDILVANNGGEFMGSAPYLLLNDGAAIFTVNQKMLPERVVSDSDYWPWAADMPDLDSDGHADLLMGGKDDSGQSFIH